MKIAEIRQELAHLDGVKPLAEDRYASCLATYEAASNQRERIFDWFANDVIPDLSRERSSVLSVGCGAGDLDRRILASGANNAQQITYVGIESDPGQCARFIGRMGFANDPNVQIEAKNIGFEEYQDARRFDLVLLVHSLYYMTDPARAVANALELTGEHGRLAILLASNDALNELSSSFWALQDSTPSWFSEDLTAHLENLDVSFERKRIEAALDVTTCLAPESEQGEQIADFIAQVSTAELPQELRGMIFSYLEQLAQRDGEQRWLPHNVDAFMIQPGSSAKQFIP